MRVLADTPIWSESLRRSKTVASAHRSEFAELLREGAVELIGPIRQELLSGIRDKAKYETLRARLRSFLDLPVVTDDYERAAQFYSLCRSSGIQGSSTDFLICAVAYRYGLEIFTTDHDFSGYEKVLPIRLYKIPLRN